MCMENDSGLTNILTYVALSRDREQPPQIPDPELGHARHTEVGWMRARLSRLPQRPLWHEVEELIALDVVSRARARRRRCPSSRQSSARTARSARGPAAAPRCWLSVSGPSTPTPRSTCCSSGSARSACTRATLRPRSSDGTRLQLHRLEILISPNDSRRRSVALGEPRAARQRDLSSAPVIFAAARPNL